MMYTIQYSPFARQWLVINQYTGIVQSAWKDKWEAYRLSKSLSKQAKLIEVIDPETEVNNKIDMLLASRFKYHRKLRLV